MGDISDDSRKKLRELGWSDPAIDLGIDQKFKCIYCDRDLLASIEDYDVWQFDHLIPISKGGPDNSENLVVACKLCNFVKRNFNVKEIAGENAPWEEYEMLARAFIVEKRREKAAKLTEVQKILLDADLISRERIERWRS